MALFAPKANEAPINVSSKKERRNNADVLLTINFSFRIGKVLQFVEDH
jgi:hypothetical protein